MVIKSPRMKRTSEKVRATIDPGKVMVFIVFLKSQHTIYLFSKAVRACSVTQSYPALCNTMDYSPPGSFVHGISQVRILEWVTISFSRRILLTQIWNPCLLLWQVGSLPLSSQGSPTFWIQPVKLQIEWNIQMQF